MTFNIGLLETYFAVFQYVLPMESFTGKLSSAKKSLSKILTQKSLQTYVLKTQVANFHVLKKPRFSVLFTFKDKINKMLHSTLVYKFKCNICNDIYYGKTKRHFKVRACEHLGITPLTGKKVKKPKRKCSI